MYFVFIKIFNVDCKEDIILALQSVGIDRGSLYSAINLDKTLNDELPLFTGFFKTEEDKAKKQYIITTLMEDKDTIKQFLNNLRESGMDIDNEDIIRLVAMPVNSVFDTKIGFKEFD